MGSPVVTARSAPVGIKLDDGYSTTIALSQDPDISFWEKTVQPPGFEGGEPIDTSTMHNTNLRTMSSRQLKTMTPMQVTAAYDPAVFEQINDVINEEGSITVHFPDGSTLAFFGFVQNFQPTANSEGAQPEATITIVPTNVDPSDGSEAEPVVNSVAGT